MALFFGTFLRDSLYSQPGWYTQKMLSKKEDKIIELMNVIRVFLSCCAGYRNKHVILILYVEDA